MALSQPLTPDYSVIEYVIKNSDDETVGWLHEYILTKNSRCEKNEYTPNCFASFCRAGDNMDEDLRNSWLDVKSFQDYMKGIVNTVDGLDSINDLNDWHSDLSTCRS